MIKFYQYKNCGTCKKAKKFLDSHQISYEDIDITEQPPAISELQQMLAAYENKVRKLFNTSGQLYREFDIKNKLPTMTEQEALSLLHQHGKLIKRPFLIQGAQSGLVGFKEDEWQKALL